MAAGFRPRVSAGGGSQQGHVEQVGVLIEKCIYNNVILNAGDIRGSSGIYITLTTIYNSFRSFLLYS